MPNDFGEDDAYWDEAENTLDSLPDVASFASAEDAPVKTKKKTKVDKTKKTFRMGSWSKGEDAFILENADRSNMWVAEQLNRKVANTIKRKEMLLAKQKADSRVSKDNVETNEILAILKNRAIWQDLELQYTKDEMRIVEYHWVNLHRQFRGDLLHTEEMQVLKLINLEVLMDRNMKDRKSTINEMAMLENMVDRERAKGEEDITLVDMEKINRTLENINQYRNSLQASHKNYMDLSNRYKDQMKELKGTREQRFKESENSKESFFSWIKMLDDTEFRIEASRRAEAFKVSVEREKEKLGAYHVYRDGVVDRPLLNHETVKGKEKKPKSVELTEDEILENASKFIEEQGGIAAEETTQEEE